MLYSYRPLTVQPLPNGLQADDTNRMNRVSVCVRVHVCVCMCVHVCMYMYVCICTYVRILCMYVCIRKHVCMYTYVCVYVCRRMKSLLLMNLILLI